MSVPRKYRAIGDFHEYYNGTRRAPYLTVFVGGNHESSSYLQELYYGGWVAPDIYYLGAANVIRLNGLRIAGLSGIWKGYNFNKPHFERLPYSANEVKSIYHVREIDTRKLLLLKSQVDIAISHDWPRGIEWKGDHKRLFRQKSHFESDAKSGALGSTAAKQVMDRLRPFRWFAAHLHCKYAAVQRYDSNEAGIEASQKVIQEGSLMANGTKNEEEIDIDLDEEEPAHLSPRIPNKVENLDEIDVTSDSERPATVLEALSSQETPSNALNGNESIVLADVRAQLPASFSRPLPPTHPIEISNTRTDFLALDKCLPGRDFLQVLEIEPHQGLNSTDQAQGLSYDAEWLAILRVFASHDPHLQSPVNQGEATYATLINAERKWVEENLVRQSKMKISTKFDATAPFSDGRDINSIGEEQPMEYSNPQTKAFCELIGIPNWFDDSEDVREQRRQVKGPQIEAEAKAGTYRGNRGGRGRGGGRGGWRGGRRGR